MLMSVLNVVMCYIGWFTVSIVILLVIASLSLNYFDKKGGKRNGRNR